MVKYKKDCTYCRIRKGELPTNLIYYDDKCFVILDIYPSQRGHMLVISREHYGNLLVTPDQLSNHMLVVAKKFSSKAKRKLNAPAIKLVVNTGKEAGQLVHHTHIHIIPHYSPILEYTTGPNPQITKAEAEKLLKALSEISNAHAFQNRNLDIL